MSTAQPPAPAQPPATRHRLRYVVPLVLLGGLLLAVLIAYLRGTWADSQPRDPASASEGIICRLYQPAKENWQVRCSMVLGHPPEKVWAVVTDYPRFAEIFPTLESAEHERQANGDVRLRGVAHSQLGDWPFDLLVKHEVTPGQQRWHSYWDGKGGKVQQLKGDWTVTPVANGGTLLVYTSHAEIKGYPDWVIVNAMFARQPKVMQAVADWLANHP